MSVLSLVVQFAPLGEHQLHYIKNIFSMVAKQPRKEQINMQITKQEQRTFNIILKGFESTAINWLEYLKAIEYKRIDDNDNEIVEMTQQEFAWEFLSYLDDTGGIYTTAKLEDILPFAPQANKTESEEVVTARIYERFLKCTIVHFFTNEDNSKKYLKGDKLQVSYNFIQDLKNYIEVDLSQKKEQEA